MWTCPDCGRSFANTNQWHACQDTTESDYLVGRSDLSIAIYRQIVSALQEAGDFRLHAQQTRIGFISKMTFAGVHLARRWVDLSFILPEALDTPRNRKLELYGPTSWGHHLRLASPDDVDADLRAWLAEALRRGNQETLDSSRVVTPLTPTQLDIFWTGFRAKVAKGRLRLPGYVADALTMVDLVQASLAGQKDTVALDHTMDGTYIDVDPGLGLGEGDQVGCVP